MTTIAPRIGAVTTGAMAAPAAHDRDAEQPSIGPGTTAPAGARTDTGGAKPGRSGFTAALTGIAVIGGATKGLVLDRARALAAFPHARSQGRTAMWTAQLLSGRMTNDVVPITGGTIRVAGRTLTNNGFMRAYQLSNGINLALLGASMLYGIPNLVEGWQDGGGPSGLLETRHGRTGVFGTTGTIFQLGVMAAAASGVPAGTNRITGMLKSPIISSGPIILAGIAIGLPVAINELGFLDFLNADNDLSPGDNAAATVARHADTLRGWLNLD